MENKNEYDYLSAVKDREYKSLIKNEIILFSDVITKINRFNMAQERNILITDKAIYNLKKKDLKRRFDLKELQGVTISKSTDEFVLHGNNAEYDYHYSSAKRKTIITVLAKGIEILLNEDVKLFEIEEKDITNIITLKKEKKSNSNFSRMPHSNQVSIKDYLKEITGKIGISSGLRSSTLFTKRKEIPDVLLEDFQFIKVLGRGSFGKVFLAEHSATKEIYAIKSIKKDVIINHDQISNTLREKDILQSLEHPFLVGLVFCFQTEERVYFVMPYLPGGELFQQLRKFRIFDEGKVRFYGSQIALALAHLHQHGIVYRDLKPENILLDEQGYIKLADFGLAKLLKEDEKAKSFCGTPEYIPPEILTGEGHNKAADWWSFGIVLYEMFCGIPPFYNDNIEKMYNKIKFDQLTFPKKIKLSSDATDLITKLLDRNPKTRLGSKDDLTEIQNHPFFSSLDFDFVLNKKLNPPFIPLVTGKLDVHNFDEDFTNENVVQTQIETKNLEMITKHQDKFKCFDK